MARDWGSALNALMQCSILLNLVTPLLLPAAPASSLWVLLAPLGVIASPLLCYAVSGTERGYATMPYA